MSSNSGFGVTFRQWGGGTALFFSFTHLTQDLCTGLLTALLPLIKEGLGLTYLQSGILLSAYTITSGLSQIPGGWIGDRLRRNIVVAVGLGGVGLATVAVGLSPSYYPMIVILVIMGILAGGYHPSAVSMLSGYYEEARRGRVIALHMVGGSIGFTIGPLLGGLIADSLGWRFAFIILGLPAISAVPIIMKRFALVEKATSILSSSKITEKELSQTQKGSQKAGIFQVLRPLATILFLCVAMQLIAGAAMSFVPLYLVDKHAIAPAYAAVLVGVLRFGGISGSLFGGWLSDRWGRKQAVILSLVATGPVLYLLTILPFNAGFIAVLIAFGLCRYMTQATMQPYLMDSVPPYIRATAFGIYFGLALEGQSLIQPVAGYFMDIYGIADVFTVIAMVSGALSLLALLLARRA
ncbi:MAG TPA: MFS transporter [Dehalococcoidia bacterium]|nr:MFS transporter [Dehalococcoidia bacterium]